MRAPAPLILLLAASALAGCATGRIGEAVELSTAGSQAGAQLLSSAQKVQTAFDSSVTDDRFLRALQAAGVPPGSSCSLITDRPLVPLSADPPPEMTAEIDKVAARLRSRTELAAALGKTYSGMNALATYDARGAVEGGLADVFSATNSFRTTVGLGELPPSLTNVIPAIGGALVERKQLKALKAASARLRTALGYYREALVAGQQGSVSTMRNEIGESYALRIALWRRGYLNANNLLSGIGGSSGLTVPAAEHVRITARDEAMCKGVRAALEGERDNLRQAAADEYATQIDVVDELIAAHEKFEKGAPVDAAHLAALLDRLTGLAEKIGGKDAS
jgi:hypothetical protein